MARKRAQTALQVLEHLDDLSHAVDSAGNLDRSIALCNLERGRARIGETVYVPMPGGSIPAVVCDPVFIDKEGKRTDA